MLADTLQSGACCMSTSIVTVPLNIVEETAAGLTIILDYSLRSRLDESDPSSELFERFCATFTDKFLSKDT